MGMTGGSAAREASENGAKKRVPQDTQITQTCFSQVQAFYVWRNNHSYGLLFERLNTVLDYIHQNTLYSSRGIDDNSSRKNHLWGKTLNLPTN